jgi:hypothetical protein
MLYCYFLVGTYGLFQFCFKKLCLQMLCYYLANIICFLSVPKHAEWVRDQWCSGIAVFLYEEKNKEVLIRLIIYVEPRRLDDLWRMDILFLYKGTISGLTQAINKHAHISFFIANISYTWTSTYPHFQFVCIFQVNLEYLVRVVFKQMASCTLTAWLALKLLSAGSWSLNHSEFLG